jgi:hypothetical protein
VSLLHLLLELSVRVLVDRNVLEHPLQFASVFETARILEFTNHRRFGILGGGSFTNESIRQHLGVELLENVLVFDVLEDRHLFESKDF